VRQIKPVQLAFSMHHNISHYLLTYLLTTRLFHTLTTRTPETKSSHCSYFGRLYGIVWYFTRICATCRFLKFNRDLTRITVWIYPDCMDCCMDCLLYVLILSLRVRKKV